MGYGFLYTLPTLVGSHTDLPILLKTVDFPAAAIDGSGDAILDGGGNLRAYTDDTKTTRLSVDVVLFDSSGTPNAEVWIKLPTAATGSTIFIEADDVLTAQPAVDAAFGQESVWTEAETVLLMEQSASNDRSGNYTWADTGTPANIAGPYGRANTFLSTDRYTTEDDYLAAILSTNDVTITTLSSCAGPSNGECVMGWNNPTGAIYPRNIGGDGDCVAFWWNGNVWNATTIVPQSAGWTHIAVTTRGSTDHELYHQGVSIATSGSNRTGGDASTIMRVGGYGTASHNFDNPVAQVIIWSSAKSTDWIAVGYDNQTSATAWGTVGTWAEVAPAVSLARWLFDEASTGTGPTTVFDYQGSNDLTIDYSAGDANWTSESGGNGLDLTAAPITTDSAIAELLDIATNGDIGSSYADVTELSCIVRTTIDTGDSDGARVIGIGTPTGNGDFAIVAEAANLAIRFNGDAGGATVSYALPSGITTIAVVVDSTDAIAANRVRLYLNGSTTPETATSGVLTQNTTLGSIDNTDRSMYIGNRPSQNRNFDGQIWYAELFTGQLTDDQIVDSHAALVLNNDADWASVPPDITGDITQTVAALTQALTGTVTLPTGEIEGDITQTISALTQALTGTETSNLTGNVIQAISPLTQALVGTVEGDTPPVTGVAGYTYTLPTITGTHVDLPVLLKTSDFPAGALDGSGTALLNGGGNLRAYTDDTRTLRLSVDVVTLVSSGSPEAEVWVKVPSAVTGSTIYIEADGVETTQPAIDAAFGQEDVWTVAETVLLMESSSSNDRSGNYSYVDTGVPSNIAGPFGRANSFAGTDRFTNTDIALTGILGTNDTTVSIVVRMATEQTGQPAIAWEGPTGAIYPWTTDGPGDAISFWWGGNLWETQVSPQGASIWSHIDITTRALGDNEMYHQGGSVATSSSARNSASTTFRVGGFQASGQNFDNDIAQVIIYKTARTADWVALTYDMTTAPSNWGTVGAWEGTNTTTPVGNITQTVSALTQALTGTEISSQVGNIVQSVSPLTQALVGSILVDGTATGNVTQTVGTLTQGLTGTVVTPAIDAVYFRLGSVGNEVVYFADNADETITYISRVGRVTQDISGMTQGLTGTEVSNITGNILQAGGSLSQSLTSSSVGASNGNITQTVGSLSQGLVGAVVTPPPLTGNVTQTLGVMTQGLVGTRTSNISSVLIQNISPLNQLLRSTPKVVNPDDNTILLKPLVSSLVKTLLKNISN